MMGGTYMQDNKHTASARRMARPKKGWSVVDTVIVLLLLLAIAGLVGRGIYGERQKDATGTDGVASMYAVYFEVTETHADVLAEVRGFDAVYLYENDSRLGHIGVYEDPVTGEHRVALTVLPAEGATGDRRVTATGCLICTDGIPAGGGLLIQESDQYLTPGSEIEVRTDRAFFTIRVTEIRPHS